uniref:Secreted phosphoprotein 24 n=1 Tax=Oncorhynchus kisutch TaxID=8019 RepID=A0A8C7FWT5_ONCKI
MNMTQFKGLPLYQSELASTADKALDVTMTQVNNLYAGLRLYRVTRGSIKRVVPLGLNTYDLMMNFGIKETDCLKSSGEDPQRCAFRVGFFVPAASCTARVRVTAELTRVVSLNCGQDSSSSESSSEEALSCLASLRPLSFPVTLSPDKWSLNRSQGATASATTWSDSARHTRSYSLESREVLIVALEPKRSFPIKLITLV